MMIIIDNEFKEDNNINITNPTLLPRKVDIQVPHVKENVSKETLQNSISDAQSKSKSKSKRIN